MRSLNKNKRQIYYAVYTGKTPILDGTLETGESKPTYGDVTKLHCNVGVAVGENEINTFGGLCEYTRSISVTDTNCPLAEDSIVWFGVEPNQDKSNYNYIVIKKADTKNSILYVLQEVKVR